MTKKILSNIHAVAAMLLTAATLAACSGDDNIADEPQRPDTPKTLTMTVEATKGDAATTRALTLDGKTLNATWTEGDKVTVLKLTGTNSYNQYWTVAGQLTAGNVSADGTTCSLTGEFEEYAFSVGNYLRLVFPGDKASGNSYTMSYTGQDGTLATIATDYDYCSTSAQKSKAVQVTAIDGTKITTTDASFDNNQAIVRFTLTDVYGDPIYPTSLTISAKSGTSESLVISDILTGDAAMSGTGALTLSLDGQTNEVFAALRGFSNKDVTLSTQIGNYQYSYVKTGVTFTNGKFYDITVRMEQTPRVVKLDRITGDVTLRDGDTATGTLGGNYKITIADGATVTLDGVTINGIDSDDYLWAGITCLGDATIVLKEGTENSVRGFISYYPGILSAVGKTLTIEGTGSLTASSNGIAPGIGSGSEVDGGNIHIKSGTITATGGGRNPAIGAGMNASCGTITISGGNVTAIGGNNCACIGCALEDSHCGAILIEGGTITATASNTHNSVCIGGPRTGNSTCSSITITTGITMLTLTNGTGNSVIDFLEATTITAGDFEVPIKNANGNAVSVNWLFNYRPRFREIFTQSTYSNGTWVIAP